MTRIRRTRKLHALLLGVVALAAPSFGAGAEAVSPADAITPQEEMAERVRALPNGLYSVTLDDGYTFTTHGGDPRVAGEDFDQLEPGAEERAPVCATGHVQHVLYGYPPGVPGNRIDEVVEDIRAQIRRMNAVLNYAAEESGDTSADYRVLCDETGEIRVDAFENTTVVPYITTVIEAARAAGFDDPDVDYNIFYDGDFPGICGIAELGRDDRPDESNRNNDGGYAVTYQSCWFSRTPMHENGHNQGAVQTGAPNEDGTNHCTEQKDVMCYPSTSAQCAAQVFDCGFDTYFDASPEPGEWLDSHWNMGSPANRYIVFGGAAPPPPPAEIEVYVRAPRAPARGSRIKIVAGTTECSEAAEVIALERKSRGWFQPVGEKVMDDDCEAAFTLRADFDSATFRATWVSEDGETIVSPPRRVRTR